jgi:hypothetical protein
MICELKLAAVVCVANEIAMRLKEYESCRSREIDVIEVPNFKLLDEPRLALAPQSIRTAV